MKRTILLVILGVCAIAISCSAQSYFNTRSTNNSFANSYSSVIESNGAFYCTGVALDSLTSQQIGSPYYHAGIRFTVINKDGGHIRDTIFQLPDRDLNAWNNNLRRLNNGSFLLAAYDIDTFAGYHQLIVNFDSTGQVLWYKEFSKTTCGGNAGEFWRLEDFQPTGTGEWLLLATIACHQYNNQSDYNLIKLDSAFNVIWDKTYGAPTINNFGGRILIDGSRYIMAGGYNTYNVLPNTTIYKAEMFKLDTAGNELVHKLINNPNRTNTIKDIIKTQDGNYVYCGAGDGYESPPNPFFADVFFKAWIQKLDTGFNPIWSKTYNSSYYSSEFEKLIEKPNGELLIFGDKYEPVVRSSSDYDLHTKGWFMRLSTNGDSLAQRTYYAAKSCNDQNLIYDVKRTLDGGFIIAGASTDQCAPLNPPVQRAWLIKVDSNGCSSASDPQCWPVAVPHSPHLAIGEYKVYPNPVSSELRISYTNASLQGAVIQVTDVVGRIINQTVLERQSGSIGIDVRKLESGIYLYRILENGILRSQGKVTKQ